MARETPGTGTRSAASVQRDERRPQAAPRQRDVSFGGRPKRRQARLPSLSAPVRPGPGSVSTSVAKQASLQRTGRVWAYADDIGVVLHHAPKQLPEIVDALAPFGQSSGLHLNLKKCEI